MISSPPKSRETGVSPPWPEEGDCVSPPPHPANIRSAASAADTMQESRLFICLHPFCLVCYSEIAQPVLVSWLVWMFRSVAAPEKVLPWITQFVMTSPMMP